MKIIVIPFLLLILGFRSYAQKHLNLQLQRKLDSINMVHQEFNKLLKNKHSKQLDSLYKAHGFSNPEELITYYQQRQKQRDSTNLIEVKSIIAKFGYPGKSLAGEPTNQVAYKVIYRHLLFNRGETGDYIRLIKAAVDAGEVPENFYKDLLLLMK